jgi:glucokinase-like ROK family protein
MSPTPPEQRFSGSLSPSHLDSVRPLIEVIREFGSISRSDLIERTGLSRAVVGHRVADLVERGLVASGSLGESTGGRAPRLLRFRAEAGHLLVADIGATGAEVALTDLAGRVLAQRSEEDLDVASGPEMILGRIREIFEALQQDHGAAAGPLWGIGIGVPGPVEFTTGRVISPPIMPGWNKFPIGEFFAASGVPVWVDNDANVMALGETRAGCARGHDSIIFIKVGTGIGAGLIMNGRIHRGADGCAGDVGHIQVTADPNVVCRCGNIGCVEALAGGAGIARAAEQAARENPSGMLQHIFAERRALAAADVGWCAAHGDQASMELVANAARLVGGVLATLVNVLNPSMIVIGGGVSHVGDPFLAAIRETLYGRSFPLATRALAIQPSTLGRTCGVIGLAAMVTDQLFSPEILSEWLPRGRPSAVAV